MSYILHVFNVYYRYSILYELKKFIVQVYILKCWSLITLYTVPVLTEAARVSAIECATQSTKLLTIALYTYLYFLLLFRKNIKYLIFSKLKTLFNYIYVYFCSLI